MRFVSPQPYSSIISSPCPDGRVPSSTRPGFLFSTLGLGLFWLLFWDCIWCIYGYGVHQQSAHTCCVPGSVEVPGRMKQFSRTCAGSFCDLCSWPGWLKSRVTRKAVTSPPFPPSLPLSLSPVGRSGPFSRASPPPCFCSIPAARDGRVVTGAEPQR